ncbi:MAG: molecular chaperone TorD family protein [Halodesulfovibrio sp.]
MSEPTTGVGLTALRDFFSARNAEELRAAAGGIAICFHQPLDAATDWREVEYDFNRLFVGPLAIPAPPYASAYQTEPQLMGPPALAVRAAYRQLGLAVPDEGSTPDDHLAYELDAVSACDTMLAQHAGNAADAVSPQTVSKVREWLVCEHLSGWMPLFVQAVSAQPNVSQPVAMAVSALEQWLADAKGALPADNEGLIHLTDR